MDCFLISPEVAEQLPQMRIVTVTAKDINNTGNNEKVEQYAKETAESVLSNFRDLPNAQSHPRIAACRNTLKEKFRLSTKKFPQSNESLYKRLLKDRKAAPSINPTVDFYNSVSIKHAVTAGAFDLDALKTRSSLPLELRLSRAEDSFLALSSGDGEEGIRVSPGELSYAQGSTILTRHLAWRQSVQGLVTSDTKDVIFVSEILCESGVEVDTLAEIVARELVSGLARYFGVNASSTTLKLSETCLSTLI